jgi:hypothetical protein
LPYRTWRFELWRKLTKVSEPVVRSNSLLGSSSSESLGSCKNVIWFVSSATGHTCDDGRPRTITLLLFWHGFIYRQSAPSMIAVVPRSIKESTEALYCWRRFSKCKS